jgi:hypothetical protein
VFNKTNYWFARDRVSANGKASSELCKVRYMINSHNVLAVLNYHSFYLKTKATSLYLSVDAVLHVHLQVSSNV